MELINADPDSSLLIGCAIEVHRTLDPGSLEAVYEACLCRELATAGHAFVRQQTLPVIYRGELVNCDLKMDTVVARILLLEIKAVHTIHPVHEAQLLTYLKVSGVRWG
jgi:GxxExxY protein